MNRYVTSNCHIMLYYHMLRSDNFREWQNFQMGEGRRERERKKDRKKEKERERKKERAKDCVIQKICLKKKIFPIQINTHLLITHSWITFINSLFSSLSPALCLFSSLSLSFFPSMKKRKHFLIQTNIYFIFHSHNRYHHTNIKLYQSFS